MNFVVVISDKIHKIFTGFFLIQAFLRVDI